MSFIAFFLLLYFTLTNWRKYWKTYLGQTSSHSEWVTVLVSSQSYSEARLMGTETQGGLFPSLLQRLATKATHRLAKNRTRPSLPFTLFYDNEILDQVEEYEKVHSSSQSWIHLISCFLNSVVVLEGEGAGKCLLRLQDLPGTLLMDSLLALPPNPNLTFVVEVRALEGYWMHIYWMNMKEWWAGQWKQLQCGNCCPASVFHKMTFSDIKIYCIVPPFMWVNGTLVDMLFVCSGEGEKQYCWTGILL